MDIIFNEFNIYSTVFICINIQEIDFVGYVEDVVCYVECLQVVDCNFVRFVEAMQLDDCLVVMVDYGNDLIIGYSYYICEVVLVLVYQ